MHKFHLVVFFVVAILGMSLSCDENSDQSKSGVFYSDCVTTFEQDENFEVVTFNLEQFPKKNNTIMHVAELLVHLNADVVAVQEISNEGALKELADKMEEWEYVYSPNSSGSLTPGFLIKMSEIELIEDETRALFEDDNYRFPRSPLMVKVKHRKSGVESYLINLHLKAMGDEESVQRRLLASHKLKELLDEEYSHDYVIVLGDFNDELDEENPEQNVFHNFIVSENYRFTDMSIAQGEEENWSYPGWPSHIDHILISDEWFDAVDTTMTLSPDACFDNYEKFISDHRPVVSVFEID